MPPAYSESEPGSGSEEIIEPRKLVKGKAVADDEMAEEEDANANADEVMAESEDEEGGDEDNDEEEYVVEKILSHSFEFPDSQLRYLTKWLGYEEEKDQTWEPKENLLGAKEALAAYHKFIGGAPTNAPKESKKRPRKSGGKSTLVSIDKGGESSESATKKVKSVKKPDGRGRKKKDVTNTPVDKDQTKAGDWLPPSPLQGSWEDLVLTVETIDCDPDGTKWAMLKWSEINSEGTNRRSRSLLQTAHFACPQKMLTFYEKHLKFFEEDKKPKKLNNSA